MTDQLTIVVHGEPVVLTASTIDSTWKHYADFSRELARAAKAGEFFVNDVDAYVEGCERDADQYDAHEGRMSLTFVQQAYLIQSGVSVPLLSA